MSFVNILSEVALETLLASFLGTLLGGEGRGWLLDYVKNFDLPFSYLSRHELTDASYVVKPPKGKHSVKGMLRLAFIF